MIDPALAASIIAASPDVTLVVAPDSEDLVEDAIDAAVSASREHPCRIIVVVPADRLASDARLDGQLRVGGDAGAGEVVVLRISGPLSSHASSVVLPFLLPDTPVVAWWPGSAPEVPARDPLGKLAIRRITDATGCDDPLASIRSRLQGYTGDIEAKLTRVAEVGLRSAVIPRVEFIVGGNELGSGIMGILGRNFLSMGDTEYDLAHGIVRLVLPQALTEVPPLVQNRLGYCSHNHFVGCCYCPLQGCRRNRLGCCYCYNHHLGYC